MEWPVEILDNKYTKWYKNIVFRAQARQLPAGSYVEKHHIVPRSLGGNNSKANIAHLTAREHFICHWLLIKMLNPGVARSKMYRALNFMRATAPNQQRYATAITSRVYEQIRPIIVKEQAKLMTGRVPSESQRKKMSESMKGRPKSPEHIKKMSEQRKGKPTQPWSEETRKKFEERIALQGGAMKGKNHSQEARAKMSKSQRARITDEERAIRSQRATGENNPMFGRKQTEEAKKKMSRQGMKHTEESKAKMRAARAKHAPRKLSEETKQKLSKARKEWWANQKVKQ